MSGLLKIADEAYEALSKEAASLQAANNKLYGRMLKRLHGGWDAVMKKRLAGAPLGMYHGTPTAENLAGILQGGIKANPGSYGTGAYVGELAKARNYGENIVRLKGPSEVTAMGIKYPSNLRKVDKANYADEMIPFQLVLQKGKKMFDMTIRRSEKLYKGRPNPQEYIKALRTARASGDISMRDVRNGISELLATNPGVSAQRIKDFNRHEIIQSGGDIVSRVENSPVIQYSSKVMDRYSNMVTRRVQQLAGDKGVHARRFEATGVHPVLGDLLAWQKSPAEMHFPDGLSPQLLTKYTPK